MNIMESLGENKPLTGGDQKIEEYVSRIKNGESKDSIFQGLPESFNVLVKELQSLALNVELMESDMLTEKPHNTVEQ